MCVPYIKHKALIVGRTLKGDCDKTLLIVTEDGKKYDATIRKARDSSAKWACVTEPVSEVELELYVRKHKATIVSMKLVKFFSNITKNPSSAIAEAMIFEIISEILQYDVPEPAIYEKLLIIYNILDDTAKNHLSALAWFISSFMMIIGYQIITDKCIICQSHLDGDAYFDIKKGSVVCRECVTKGNIFLPEFARKTLSIMEHVNPSSLSLDPKLSKGIIELYSRIIENRFDLRLKTMLHLKNL